MQSTKLNKILLPGAALALATSLNVAATSTTYDVGFTTVPEITLVQVRAMDFGDGMLIGTGNQCVMTVSASGGGNYGGNTLLKIATGAADAADANYEAMSGTGCSTPGIDGTSGLYKITGVPGGTVTVTANNNASGTSFAFDPVGCVANYNAASNGDICKALPTNTATTAVLASSADTSGNAGGSGIPVVGEALINLGGTITAAIDFTAGTTYTESFVIDVTY